MQKVSDIVHKQSGLLGVSGVSSDSATSKKRRRTAIARRLRRTSLLPASKIHRFLCGGDGRRGRRRLLAGIGENGIGFHKGSARIWSLWASRSIEKSNCRGKEVIFQRPIKVTVMVVPTDEEMAIARDTKRCAEKRSREVMEKYLGGSQSWKHRLVLSAVRKTAPRTKDSFSVHLDRPVSYWDQIYTLLSDPLVKVEACRSEGRVVVIVSLRTEVGVPCARCLEPARSEIGGELRYIFSLRRDERQREESEEGQDGEEEMIVLDSWEDEIDLGQLIWEVLITALPGRPLLAGLQGLTRSAGYEQVR
ncbi:MAG: YceD family protein [Cloacibacillus evryensis]